MHKKKSLNKPLVDTRLSAKQASSMAGQLKEFATGGKTNAKLTLNPPSDSQPTPTNGATGYGWWNSAPPPLMGGRQTLPTNPGLFGYPYNFLPRRAWHGVDLTDIRDVTLLNPQQILDMLADLSPEVSQAVWNNLRMVNSGWKFNVKTKDGTKELPKGKELLEKLLRQFNAKFGGINMVIGQLIFSLYLQGAAAAELVLSRNLEEVVDFVAVQPWTIYFQRDITQNFAVYQLQTLAYPNQAAGYNQNASGNSNPPAPGVSAKVGDKIPQALNSTANTVANAATMSTFPFRRLNLTTFTYVPLDPSIDDPYGRSPAAPVLQLILFDIQFLRDMRQSVHMSVWGRLHMQADEDKMLANAPALVRNDPTGDLQLQYLTQRLAYLQEAYEKLAPDDAFISTNAVDLKGVNFAGGTLQIDNIARFIERRVIRALKQLPVLMGSNEGTTETHGTVQYEIYANGIRSLQNIVAGIMDDLLTVALEFYGIDGRCEWEFEPVRSVSRQDAANALKAEMDNLDYQVQRGWITNDDAAIQVTGSKAVTKLSIPYQMAYEQLREQKGKADALEVPPDSCSGEALNQARLTQEQGKAEQEVHKARLVKAQADSAEAEAGVAPQKNAAIADANTHKARLTSAQADVAQANSKYAEKHADYDWQVKQDAIDRQKEADNAASSEKQVNGSDNAEDNTGDTDKDIG